jgi:hypothetical protein
MHLAILHAGPLLCESVSNLSTNYRLGQVALTRPGNPVYVVRCATWFHSGRKDLSSTASYYATPHSNPGMAAYDFWYYRYHRNVPRDIEVAMSNYKRV